MQEPTTATDRHRIVFAATLPAFYDASATLRQLLETMGLGARSRANVELAFEEIGTNIVKHGNPAGNIDVRIALEPEQVVMTFEDDGVPFNPLLRDDPTPPDTIDEARVGGLGLMLIKQFSSHLHYERTPDQHNRLTLTIPAR